jgi:hypothetical protein
MGALAGHLSHLQENLDFTFGDLKSILGRVASGEMPTVEKVDGQNIFFKFAVDPDTGEVRTARNKGNLMKGGMTPDQFTAKWVNHPAEGAFINGFKAIQAALSQINPQSLKQMFTPSDPDGQRYINAEIVYTGNPNVINYNGDYIVMHNLQEFDSGGNLVDVQLQGGEFDQLLQAVDAAQKSADQEVWSVVGPQVIELKDISHTDVNQVFSDKISALGASDDMTLGDYVEEKLRTGAVGNLPIPVHKQEALIRRIIGLGHREDQDSLPALGDIKKGVTKEVQKRISALGTKTNASKTIAAVLEPIELAIHDMAVEVLRGVASAITAGHDEELDRLKASLESSKEAIMSARDADSDARRDAMEKQLKKLGDPSNIASSLEGIVFEEPPGSKALYKLTGAFAPLNQIIGRAMRIPKGQNEVLLRTYVRAFLAG